MSLTPADMADHFTPEQIAGTPAEIIDIYTHDQAVADGVLIALPGKDTREARFRIPVLMTAAAHADTVRWRDGVEGRGRPVLQDETGRLWDVLTMAMRAVQGAPCARVGDRVPFRVLRVPPTGRGRSPRPVELDIVVDECGQEPVFVILLHGED